MLISSYINYLYKEITFLQKCLIIKPRDKKLKSLVAPATISEIFS
jgi:hypothetical protein